MSKQETYKFGVRSVWWKKSDLIKIAISYRIAKKICRKCFKRLPLDSNVCRSCKNSDLRVKKYINKSFINAKCENYIFDKNTKNRLTDKRKAL